ncbi:lytic murein transglycosylase [Gracilimonas sp. Q87]|uniref:lytic murein transglycosylase n=1 Tax=Gracilimonas sp. Q87 TaxID=3384766 RepID=UPI00398436D7
MTKLTTILLLFFSLLISGNAIANHSDPGDMEKNIEELARYFEGKGYDFNDMLEDPRYEPVENITLKFTRAAERVIEDFSEYQKVLNYDHKKTLIRDFMKQYASDLDSAEKEYGIPKNVIAGILGIESEFGKYGGTYNPFNVYVSMYAEGHRAEFAKAQLEELLIFVKKNELDVFELRSSYAGAMSYAQFIPYSLNRWWVGKDLYHMPNNINSVAKYLSHFKEITGTVEGAIYRYNPSDLYTQAVLSLANEVAEVVEEAK